MNAVLLPSAAAALRDEGVAGSAAAHESLAHEASQIQMLQGMADSEERIARSRDRERQYQMLGRAGRIADYLP